MSDIESNKKEPSVVFESEEKVEPEFYHDDMDVKEPELTPESIRSEKRHIMKNVLLISVAFLMNFNAYQGLARLQSSLHRVDGMGVISQAVLYAALMLSCLFVPKLIINIIGHKWTIPLAFLGYISWMAANGYAVWATMIPTSILVGLCAAPLWTAQCSYFTIVGKRYAKLTGETEEAVISRFFGIFFCFFQMSSITGSIISSTILKPVISGNETEEDYTPETEDVKKYCGANDCPNNNFTDNPNLEDPSSQTVWTMVGVYIIIAVCAVILVSLLVDNLPTYLYTKSDNITKEIVELTLATAKHLKKRNQLLLIPLTMYSGFEQAFYNAEFTASFVTCSLGVWKVGLVTLPFGCVNALVSYFGGYAVKYVGRLPVFAAGVFMDLCIQCTLLAWEPNPETEYVFYIIAGMWGFTDGIWQTQINALYGNVFSDSSEAAFSNYRMWESFGFIIAFVYSSFICTQWKIVNLMCVLAIGIAGYLVVEFNIKKVVLCRVGRCYDSFIWTRWKFVHLTCVLAIGISGYLEKNTAVADARARNHLWNL